MFYEGEDLPQYDPASGLTPQQFWSQYPSLLQGITTKEAVYRRTPTSVEKEEIEASENVSQSYRERPVPFSPGRDPGSAIDTVSYPTFESGAAAIKQSFETGYFGEDNAQIFAEAYADARDLGLSKTEAQGWGESAAGIGKGTTPHSLSLGTTQAAMGPASGAQAAAISAQAAAIGRGETGPSGYASLKQGGKVRSFIE